jgi:hypothetical protein
MTTKTGPDFSELTSDEFRQVVDSELRGKVPPEVATAVRAPANLDRWVVALEQMLASVDGQLTSRADDYQAKRSILDRRIAQGDTSAEVDLHDLRAEHFRKRSSTIRFKSGLEERLHEARFLRDRQSSSAEASIAAEERNRFALKAAKLAEAIAVHRRFMEDEDLEPSAADERLWAALDSTS